MLVSKGSNCDIVHVNWLHMLLFNFHALVKNSSQFLLMQFLLITGGGSKRLKRLREGGVKNSRTEGVEIFRTGVFRIVGGSVPHYMPQVFLEQKGSGSKW